MTGKRQDREAPRHTVITIESAILNELELIAHLRKQSVSATVSELVEYYVRAGEAKPPPTTEELEALIMERAATLRGLRTPRN